MNKNRQLSRSRHLAWGLLTTFVWSVFQPAFLFAGGPTQPEASSFTPIGVSDMVDPFSGDFTYNIPLMDVEGYPINIAYNSGVTMDQEATWVGLGWNLNTGAITRNLRGLPDDFKGDEVVKEYTTKPSINVALDAGLKFEIAGFALPSVTPANSQGGLSVNVGLTYNNYNGFGTSISVGPSFDLGKFLGGSATAGFSLSGSSENGASFAPSASLSYKDTKSKTLDITKTGTIGTAFNSRAGLQNVSYGFSASRTYYTTKKFSFLGHNFTYRNGGSSHGGASHVGGSFDLGVSNYMPTPLHSNYGASVSLQLNTTTTLFISDPQANIGVSFSKSWIPNELKTKATPSYGYLFSEYGQNSAQGQLDFNRDNDIPFSKYSVNLPTAFQTYDLFSVSAQGTGGSFRPIRNEVGYVYDAPSSTFDVGVSAGFELGFGNLTDLGVDIQIPYTSSKNGVWEDKNFAKSALGYHSTQAGDIVPSFSFIEANERSVEQDDLMSTQFYGDKPERLELAGVAQFPKLKKELVQGSSIHSLSENTRSVRELANNQLYFLTRKEVADSMGVFPYNSLRFNPGRDHHIAEITQLGTDGRRYVFAEPVYNQFQEDATFAIGDGLFDNGGLTYSEDYSGLIQYGSNGSTLASLSNTKGIDNYYSSTQTPPYAHSYMLSAVLSDDYIDSDGQQGPTKNDLGSYVKFDYSQVSNHEWRTPIEANSGYYNEGMRSDGTDDKASFVHGKKDLLYLYKIETKNYIAIFKTVARKDGRSAQGRHGGITSADALSMQALESITLYSRPDYEANGSNATPIQQVEFKYNYSLCRHYPLNDESSSSDLEKGGKLTLTEIVFTYQNSKKMKYRSYKFDYSTTNPGYNLKASDRWGTYKPSPIGTESSLSSALSNSDFPYSDQNETTADVNASAWHLTTIHLPSGGEIHVKYESDDYAYVQHKKAGQMFQIIGVSTSSGYDVAGLSGSSSAQPVSTLSHKNAKLLFKLNHQSDPISLYGTKGQQLYFRVLSVLNPGGSTFKERTEYVSGYGIVEDISKVNISGTLYGCITLVPEKLSDAGADEFSPIAKQAILFGRTQLSRTINNIVSTPTNVSGNQALTDLANSMLGAISSFKELVTGPNRAIYDLGKGTEIIVNKSWIRLDCPTGKKKGGGSRVKEIRMKDNWDLMSGSESREYGQTFSYTLEDGITSSGVASYEPQLGGDENPWHTAYIVNNKKRLAMDDKMYIDNPIMESQFPSPSVGYSRVVIRDLPHNNVTRTATGKVVKEFYTARDFPTIVSSTDVDVLPKNSILPLLPKYQYLTASQGFSIELNDMHGKPKKESVYAENQSQPLSTIEYYYQTDNLYLGGVENKRLNNKVKVVLPDGSISDRTIGVRYDEVADFRESKTVSQTAKIGINTNSFVLGVFFAVVPTVYPGYDRTTNRFRSATMNKTIQKFGVLEKTVANQDGSIVETNNLAYDSRTGEVLVTQTTTDFNDKVYSLNYPAYWKYDAFGQASKNILYSYKASNISANGFAVIPQGVNYFEEGDEVSVSISSSTLKGWVVEKNGSGIRLIDAAGNAITGTNALIKVIRSGYKNKQNTSMASMTSISDPLEGIATGKFTNVLNAGAVEFGQDWKTYCDCFTSGLGITTNPYLLGTKGNWRPVRSYTHLSERTQTIYDGNTNIRKDGVFTSYSPFYKRSQGNWEKDAQNWTFVSEVTEFSPNGMTLETRDALGRYSSSLFGFNNTLTTAVAANAQMEQIAVGNFEDISFTNCMDQGYFSQAKVGTGSQGSIPSTSISTSQSHTGKNSIKVVSGTPITFENVISTCVQESSCNLSLNCIHTMHVCDYMNVEGGTAPYQLEVDVTGSGEAYFSDSDTVTITIDTGSDANSLVLTITDANGCKAGKKITVKNGVTYSENIQF